MIEHNGIRWNLYHRMLSPQGAPHIDPGIDSHTAKQLMAKSHALLIRWVSEFDCQTPTEWWFVIKDNKVSLEELSRNSRHDIRRGLSRCSVKKVDANFIINRAYPVYRTAFLSYKTRVSLLSEDQFVDGIHRDPHKESTDYWGVFDRASGKLVGYCKNRFEHNSCEYISGQWDPKYLNNYSSVALIYEMNRYYLNEKGALYVSDGQRSISHDTQIQEFLIHKLNFRKAYCRLNIIYSPVLWVLVNLLYPFRARLAPLGDSLSSLLKQEEIRRSFMPQPFPGG